MWTIILLVMETLMMSCAADVQPNGCEVGWYVMDDFCISFHQEDIKFYYAKAACVEYEATLASVWNEDEWDFILNANWKFYTEPSNDTGPESVATTESPLVTDDPHSDRQGYSLWLGYKWKKLLNSEVYDWGAVDMSMIQYIVWRSEEDENINKTDVCMVTAMELHNGTNAAFSCTTKKDGYICKKARPSGTTIGIREDEGIRDMNRENGVQSPSTLMTTSTFFNVQDMSLYLTNATYIPNEDYTITTEEESPICADKCLSMPLCVYYHIECRTANSICDSIACKFFTYP